MPKATQHARIPEKAKKPGLSYAVTQDGIELPVIDVTHPAFAIDLPEPLLSELTRQFIRDAERRAKVPAFLQRLFLRLLLRRSILAQGLMGAEGTFLRGINTYLMKLGPENLGRGYAGPMDRKIAASLPALLVRLRLVDMARLLAKGLAPALEERPGRPCHLVNIGGGPAADSLNALILLRKERPASLEGRRILIVVLDVDDVGPAFGARALGALLARGAPLHGLDICLEHIRYDWASAEDLRSALAAFTAEDAVVGGSSEGALFDYGADDEIVANLSVFRDNSPRDAIMVGSVTRVDGPARPMNASSRVSTRPRALADFEALVRRSGWAVAQAIEAPFSYHVSLLKA